MVRDPDIVSTMRNRNGLKNTADSLVDGANAAGGDDNISVILVKCEQ
jgi:serine/threonine protein phosphatase PrpC